MLVTTSHQCTAVEGSGEKSKASDTSKLEIAHLGLKIEMSV